MFFIYGVAASILLSSPYIFINEYNKSASFIGWIICLTIICLIIGASLNTQLLKKYDPKTIITFGIIVKFLAMIALIFSSLATTYVATLIILLCYWLVELWVYPNLLTLVCSIYPKYKGTTIALFSFILILGGAVFSLIGAFVVLDSVIKLSVIGTIGMFFAIIFWISYVYSSVNPIADQSSDL